MAEIQMPEGRYFSLSGMIRAGTGGQTRALLMRNRILTQRAGIDTTLLTFDSSPVYPEVRSELEAHEQLVPGMQLLNIFEWYRDAGDAPYHPRTSDDAGEDAEAGADKGAAARGADALPELDDFVSEDEAHPDGTIYRTVYRHKRSGSEAVHDYRRADGTVYLRTPAGPGADSTPATAYHLVNREGVPVQSWARKGGWHRLWLRTLAGDAERVFVISDSRFALAHIVPMRDQRFHVLHLMHNAHTVGQRVWNSPLSLQYGPLLKGIRHLDGLVTLTARQREDVIERYGETNNLFVVPNPVDLPVLPEVMPQRERARFAVVSRLERQKRLDDAVRIWPLVLEQEPDARLDIYGDGNLRVPLQELIDELGVGHRVTLCGHSPHARENLLTATGFVMTSRFEGYPLASLESMSHGCPVISYDIKYGPREQITEGVDGFLTEAGDLQTFADRVVQMVRDPALVERMSRAALAKAENHDYRAFLRDWRTALETAAANKSDRVRNARVDAHVSRLGEARAPRVPRRLVKPRFAPGAFGRPPTVELAASLDLTGKARPRTLDNVVVTLDAVSDRTGGVASIPLKVHRFDHRFDVYAKFDVGDLFARMGAADRDVHLRLRVVWNNVAWETTLSRPTTARASYELNFARDDSLLLMRRTDQEDRS
jgi:poly(glycerol-phosphate) alpha-glucosyltransferase